MRLRSTAARRSPWAIWLNSSATWKGSTWPIDGITVDDDNVGSSQGNDNGVIEFGETIE